MAVTEQRVLPPEFIEAAGKTFLEDLSKATGQFKDADLSKVFGSQFVAGLDPVQQEAQALRGGLGSFAPFLHNSSSYNWTNCLSTIYVSFSKRCN